jgi:hypothetical protein
MERTEVLDMMGDLKLYGIRSAYDETLATALKRKHALAASSVIFLRPRSQRSRRVRSNTSSPSPSCRSPRTSMTSRSKTRRLMWRWCAISQATPSRRRGNSSASGVPASAHFQFRAKVRLGSTAP